MSDKVNISVFYGCTMMQRQQFLKMPERVPLPSVNKNPAQRIPPGGLEDGAKAVAFSTSPAMLLRRVEKI